MNQKYPNRHVYKITSTRLQKAKWNLTIDFETAIKNKEIVDLADSTALRFIRNIINKNNDDIEYMEYLKGIKKKMRELGKKEHTLKNANEYKRLSKEYHEKLMINDYILVEMKKGSKKHTDFDRANKGFCVNGKKFKYLLSTTGGVKNETVVYVSSDVYPEMNRRIDNGRDMDIEFTPAKASAYRSLVCSASTPVPSPSGVLVIHDYIRKVEDDVVLIKNNPDDSIMEPVIEEVTQTIQVNTNDGYGFITYRLAEKWAEALGLEYVPSAFIVRNAFCKGVLAVVDVHKFSTEIAKTSKVTDVWNDDYDVFEHNIEMVLTTSMLKMWQSYSSIKDYLDNCEENGYTFSVTKYSPENLENQRNTNYQFLQSLEVSGVAIDELTNPTIDMLNDAMGGDWAKTLLYLKGDHLTEKTETGNFDFAEALTIDKRMLNDPFVRGRIKDMISKRLDDAKKGDLLVDGQFSMIIGDVYVLLEHMYGMKNPQGLLQKDEFYSAYWNKKNEKEVVGFRAPMTVYNNIRKMNIVNSEKMQEWYEHLNNVFIVNTYDLTLAALNGADMDGDNLLTTNNKVIKDAVTNAKVIICEQESAKKDKTTRELFIQADKSGFGNKIGGITNKGTALYEVLAKFLKGTPEYVEIMKRIMSIQKGQQDEIDKAKGIETKELPNEWFDRRVWKVNDGDDESTIKHKLYNQSLVAHLKPYFFIYIYPDLMHTYKKYNRDNDTNCVYRFDMNLKSILAKEDRSEKEQEFVDNYFEYMPVSMSNSTMNRVCRKVEKDFKLRKKKPVTFDYSILKSDTPYSKDTYRKILNIYNDHNKNMQLFKSVSRTENMEEDENRDTRYLFTEDFKNRVFSVCNNFDVVTNVVVDICYGMYVNRSKQFAWDIAGEQIIKNLLSKNNNIINYPIQNENGDIEFRGKRFTMISRKVDEV